MTRETSKAITRERILSEAQRLFRERGYAATSLEQIADAADVTKGAIYGHFSGKEDLLLSAIESSPTPAVVTALNDQSRPVGERIANFARDIAADEVFRDKAGLAAELEFLAALLRSPDALRRYSADLEGRLAALAAADEDQPPPGLTVLESWGIGYALLCGLQISQHIAPGIITPAVFERAYALLVAPDPGN
ncbi:MAG: TetR/AcrR family transcriptional regulator [Trebonia sp.]